MGVFNTYFVPILNAQGEVSRYYPVGFSDYYNFNERNGRTFFAELFTAIGRNDPTGVPYDVRWGITPTQSYINSHYKH